MTNQDANPDTDRSSMVLFFGFALGAAVPMAAFGKAAIGLVLVIAFAMALALYFTRKNKTGFDINPLSMVRQPVFWVFGFWFLSSLLSLDVLKSIETLVRTAAIAGVGAVFFTTIRRCPNVEDTLMRTLVSVMLLSCAVISVLLLLEVGGAIEASDTFFGIVLDPPQRFKSFGAVAVCLIPVCLWFGWRLGGRWKAMALLCLPLTAIVLAGAGRQPSLDGLLGVVGGVTLVLAVYGLIHLPTLPRRLLGVACVVGASALFFWVCLNLPAIPVGPDPMPQLPMLDWHRQVIWGFAVDTFAQNWLFGVGPNTIDMANGARDIIPGMSQEYIPGHPHNWLFEIMAETGTLGTAALAMTLLFLLIDLGRKAARNQSGAWAGIFLCGAFWASALANFSIWAAWWQACFVVLIVIVLAMTKAREEPSS